MKKLVLVLLSICICISLFAQGKIYTKKVLLSDFDDKITKIVINPDFYPSSVLQAEIAAKWILSPYEFCTLEEFTNLKNDNNFYFLSLEKNDEIIFLTLYKGGKADEKDNFKKPIEVLSLPFCSENSNGVEESSYLGALVDIIQNYTMAAMESDNVAYAGIKYFKDASLNTKLLYFKDYSNALINNEENAAVGICVATSKYAYKMIISTDTHEMLYFRKNKNTSFTDKEINSFIRKNGIIAE